MIPTWLTSICFLNPNPSNPLIFFEHHRYKLKLWQNKKDQTFVVMLDFCMSFFWILISCLLKKKTCKNWTSQQIIGPSYFDRALVEALTWVKKTLIYSGNFSSLKNLCSPDTFLKSSNDSNMTRKYWLWHNYVEDNGQSPQYTTKVLLAAWNIIYVLANFRAAMPLRANATH